MNEFIANTSNLKLLLLSDPHLIADSLHDSGPAFQRMRDTSAGKDLDYQEIALGAFIRFALLKKPVAVIITGDLTFNGARASAEEFARLFKPLKKADIHLWVLPGNHDLYDGWAREFKGSAEYRVSEISPQDWRKIFQVSYKDAASRDDSSLAYSINLNPNFRLIMADSNIYGDHYSLTYPVTNGVIEKGELRWIERELRLAKANKQHVLFFMHHNLYRHNSVIHGGFVLDNADELKEMFRKYDVKAVFSGHIHAQNISGPWPDCPSLEIVTSCFSMTDQGYGEISLRPDSLLYERHSFDMSKFLNGAEKSKLPGLDFHEYLQSVFKESNLRQLQKQKLKFASRHDFELAFNFLLTLHWNFFTGQSNYDLAQKNKMQASLPYRILVGALPEIKNYVDSFFEVKQNSQYAKIEWKRD